SSPTRSCSGSPIAWWWRSAGWKPASSSTVIAATPRALSFRLARPSPSCAPVWQPEPGVAGQRTPRRAGLLALLLTPRVCGPPAARGDQQRDPELEAVVARAIAQAQCFTDQYDSAVWYTLMEPRLRKLVREKNERIDILKQVYCETHRPGESRLPPGLVMA